MILEVIFSVASNRFFKAVFNVLNSGSFIFTLDMSATISVTSSVNSTLYFNASCLSLIFFGITILVIALLIEDVIVQISDSKVLILLISSIALLILDVTTTISKTISTFFSRVFIPSFLFSISLILSYDRYGLVIGT